MKIIHSKLGLAIAGLSLVTAFASCSFVGSEDDYDNNSDIVYDLSAPSVSVITYPGINYVSWTPVDGAKSYTVYVYENGKYVRTLGTVQATRGVLYMRDIEIQNKVSYTYYVEANSTSNPADTVTSRAVYAKNNVGSASATAILPPYTTEALKLPAYEGGYDGSEKTVDSNDKYVLTTSNVSATVNKGDIWVTFPAKAYLNYTVKVDNGSYKAAKGSAYKSETWTTAHYATKDQTAVVKVPVTYAGTYTFEVSVDSQNSTYLPLSSTVTPESSLTVATLAESTKKTNIDSVSYLTSSSARVIFTPATLADSTTAPVSYYKVYRTTGLTGVYEAVSGEVKATGNSDGKYYVDDTLTDTSVAYTYLVAITDGTNFGTPASADLAANASVISDINVSSSVRAVDTDQIKNDITWTITLPADTTFSVYQLYKDATYTGTPVVADFDTTTALTTYADSATANKYYAYTKNAANGKYYLLVKASKTGYTDTTYISYAQEIKNSDSTVDSVSRFTANAYDSSRTNATASTSVVEDDVIIGVTEEIDTTKDSIDNYTYTLYRTTATTSSYNDTTGITFTYKNDDWNTSIATLSFAKDNSYNTTATTYSYKASYSDTNLTKGTTYAYKLVKTHKTTGEESVAIRYVTIPNTDNRASVSSDAINGLSASWVNYSSASSNVKITFQKRNNSQYPTQNANGYYSITNENNTDVTYSVWRRASVTANGDKATTVVYTKIADLSATNSVASYYDKNYSGGIDADDKYLTSATASALWTYAYEYTYTDTARSSDDSYEYLVIASQSGKQDYVTTASVSGAY